VTQSSSEAAAARALTRADDPALCRRPEPGDIGEVVQADISRCRRAKPYPVSLAEVTGMLSSMM